MPHLSAAPHQTHGHPLWPHVLLSLSEQLHEGAGFLPRGPPATAAAPVPTLQPTGQEPAGQADGDVPPQSRVPAADAAL